MAEWLKFRVLCFGGPGSWVRILVQTYATHQSRCGGIPRKKNRGTDVSSGLMFLTKERSENITKPKYKKSSGQIHQTLRFCSSDPCSSAAYPFQCYWGPHHRILKSQTELTCWALQPSLLTADTLAVSLPSHYLSVPHTITSNSQWPLAKSRDYFQEEMEAENKRTAVSSIIS